MTEKVSWIYVTCESTQQAKAIGKEVVKKRLAACANIFPAMESIYWWNGKLEEGLETVLILKTTSELAERLIAAVKRLHSYEVPCVIALPVEKGNPDYLRWIAEETYPSLDS